MNETCNKHDDCIGRINENMKKIEVGNAETQGKIDGFLKNVEEFMSSIRRDMYNKDGVMDRVGSHGNQLVLQWGLLAAIIIAIVVAYINK